MANADFTIRGDTRLDASGISKGVSSMGKIVQRGLAILGSLATGFSAFSGIQFNATIEQYATSFKVMTGSAEEAADVVERLKDMAAKTPFELTGLADTTQLLMQYGFTADEAIDRMSMLGDISQGSADKMTRIATAYGQMSSAGRVMQEDIQQMIEAGFNPLQIISEETGESMASLRERVSNGTLSVEEITQAMVDATSEGGRFYQSSEEQSKTLNGQLSTLKDNVLGFTGALTLGINEFLASDALPELNSAIEELTTSFEEGGPEEMFRVGGEMISELLEGIAQDAPDMVKEAIALMSDFAKAMLEQLPLLIDAGAQVIISIVEGLAEQAPTLIPAIVEALIEAAQAIIENLPLFLDAALELVKGLAKGFLDALPVLIDALPDLITGLVEGILEFIPDLIQTGIDLLTALVDALPEIIDGIVEAIPEIITGIAEALTEAIPDIIEAGVELFVALVSDLPTIIFEIVKAIPEIISGIVDAFSQSTGLAESGADFFETLTEKVPEIVSQIMENVRVDSFHCRTVEGIVQRQLFSRAALSLDGGNDSAHGGLWTAHRETFGRIDAGNGNLTVNLQQIVKSLFEMNGRHHPGASCFAL